jgi:hypothetical protein
VRSGESHFDPKARYLPTSQPSMMKGHPRQPTVRRGASRMSQVDLKTGTPNASRSAHSFQSAVTILTCPLNPRQCMITKNLHHCKLSLIAFHLTPTPMCKKKPTLGWGYVQTRTRREKVCPLYRVLGSLRIWKNSAFGSLKICSLPLQ